ncbi:general odorant-binding protein 56a-like [Contarinia nasturtii]|uniref:general odorant-binding protein 56a-like n=1 Tax=Contarinia nasturtii TaxID=265458 RepID=UPI0012D492D8|nr:general odorant-binding protein 56a-like [Contarinia nasturtii]
MKYFVVALCFAVICSISAVTDEQKQIADKVAKDCASENGLSAEEVQKIRTNPKSTVNDPKSQKFGKCFLSKLGFIDSNGDFQENVAVEKLSKGEDKAKVEEIVKSCKSVIGDNKDENPIKLYACYLEKKALA